MTFCYFFWQFIDAFGSVIEVGGKKIEDEQIERLFLQIDANSDGGIDWGEFSDYMLMESQANQTEIAEKVVSLLFRSRNVKNPDFLFGPRLISIFYNLNVISVHCYSTDGCYGTLQLTRF